MRYFYFISLAGRVAVLRLPSLSQNEIYGKGESSPFAIDLVQLKGRKKINVPLEMHQKKL